MIAAHHLTASTQHTHDELRALLDEVAAMAPSPGQPRKGFERADRFLAATSRHLNAVEAAILPATLRHVPDGHELVRAYVQACKALEVSLVRAKAREYGASQARALRWPDVWSDVRERLDSLLELERGLVERLAAEIDPTGSADLVDRLRQAELDAPSRPHPHAPHLGIRGRLARRLLHTVDAFWDVTESRMVPEPVRPPRKKPGLLGQYLLADPRFDEEKE